MGGSSTRTETEPAVWPCHLVRAAGVEGKLTNLPMVWGKAADQKPVDGQNAVGVG